MDGLQQLIGDRVWTRK